MSDSDLLETTTAPDPAPLADEPVKRDLMLSVGLLGVVAFTFGLTTLLTHL